MRPLVSVICLCFNHARFVAEALDSVIKQTYQPIELIVVDDASKDHSVSVICDWLKSHPDVRFIQMPSNLGNCKAFNAGLKLASGKYVIDLSGDDRLMPMRVQRGVDLMEERADVGVQFSDAELIDESGKHLGYHADRFPHDTIPQGKIFRDVLSRYFINSPTMMMRKSLLDELGGYDESLAYEDFDFWIRSSSRSEYAYIPEPLVQRRVLANSMGKQQYTGRSAQQRSTLVVCRKALGLCQEKDDFAALKQRLYFELRQALRHGNLALAWSYIILFREIP